MRTLSTSFPSAAALAVILGVAVAAPAAAQAPRFAVTDLGTLGGPGLTAAPGSVAFDLDDAGRVSGLSGIADQEGDTGAFRWNGTALEQLDTAPGEDHGIAIALGAGGEAVGCSFTLGDLLPLAVRWPGTSPVVLGTFEPQDVNGAGTIVGRRALPPTYIDTVAIRRTAAGTLTDLGTLGGRTSVAHAINEAGTIVGASFVAGDGAVHAFLRRPAGPMLDLGTLGGAASRAYDVNLGGDVVGVADTAGGESRAFLFTTDMAGHVIARLDLGALDGGTSVARGVNDAGQVVGGSDARAFLWEGGAMQDLNDLIAPDADWVLLDARAINAGGAIAGFGSHAGQPRAYLLTPMLVGDLDGDGNIGFADLSALLADWGPCPAPCPSDLDGDGNVGFTDLNLLLAGWG